MAHQHSGRSSKGFLDAESIIRKIGLKPGDTFLDAGSGEGHFSLAAANVVGAEGRVYAFDIYEESISILKKEIEWKKISNITAMVADIAVKIPLEHGVVDVCLLANVLHGLVENCEEDGALNEIARVMKTGGRLAVVDFKKMDGPPGPPMEIRLAPEDVEKLAGGYGFKMEQYIDIGPYTYVLILSRTGEANVK